MPVHRQKKDTTEWEMAPPGWSAWKLCTTPDILLLRGVN